MTNHILALDQGTTSTRAIVFDAAMQIVAQAQQEFPQHFPQSGWVEHDVEDIWQSVLATCREVLASGKPVAGIGITNQRETTVVWDKHTGTAIHHAIVWQDRRTSSLCQQLRQDGHAPMFREKTGLLLDPYFSATKVAWLLEHVDGARAKAEAGDLLFGNIDSYLIWRLTGGKRHVTDVTNASRTMLYNIRSQQWDDDLLHVLNIPRAMLPEVLDCAADFGNTDIFGTALPILGVAGDQQAATIGQCCFRPGMLKATYGTGCFALLNTGDDCVTSHNKLLTTIAYRLDGKVTYALEGSIFVAGAVVQWLRDALQIVSNAADTEALAAKAKPDTQTYLVPAFTGLGAPYWDSECRGALFGLTRDTGFAEVARAALRSVAYQTRDLYQAMQADWRAANPTTAAAVLRVDGGMVVNDWLVQSLADIVQAAVDRPAIVETTALGVAWLAGQRAGIYPDNLEAFADTWQCERTFTPTMSQADADARYAGWCDAVARVLTKQEA